ncbi:related to integral membrane, Mpv17 PMP22 family [Lecanosticta acicola]|uniref:Related to integral membrane, Mpv17 PMP22 family n=1 Tax=Lecanosticta acicola TaxID=111012 RepID=A0AAI8YUK3_9PEZI|nr:related to integral membrane, Mpv17 PMP22 family [Lecanosticta acicola]
MDSPIVTATWQAGALNALSNVLAQLITSWQRGMPYRINITELLQFVLFSVLACPPNYIWQAWLEASFPAYARRLSPQDKELMLDEATVGRSTALEKDSSGEVEARTSKGKAMTEKSTLATTDKKSVKKLDLKNTAIKFLLDQTVGAGVNTVLFVVGIGLIRGQSFSSTSQDVSEQFWPMIFAAQKLWPFVSIISFTLVPLEYRMLLGNTAGLVWGIYLSLLAGDSKVEK